MNNARPKSKYPNANPKEAIGATKVPLHLVPPSARHYLALALEDGAGKYGAFNWRESGISMSTYVGAAGRHIDALWDGEDVAGDSLVEHAAHAMACLALILDAASVGMLIDDRPATGAVSKLQAEYLERRAAAEKARLRKKKRKAAR